MIYLDNAATTWLKPPEVAQAVDEAIREKAAAPAAAVMGWPYGQLPAWPRHVSVR